MMFSALLLTLCAGAWAQTPEYSIQAIRYATSPGVDLSELVVGGPHQKVDIAMVVWLIRGGGHTSPPVPWSETSGIDAVFA